MGRKAAADFNFRCQRREIILGPFLIRIDKDKIKETLKFLHQLMGVCKPGIDIFRKPGLFEIGKSSFVPVFINFDRYEFAPRFAQSPRYPDRRMPR